MAEIKAARIVVVHVDRRRAAAVHAEDIYTTDIDGSRNVLQSACDTGASGRAYLLDRRLRHPRPPPAARGRQDAGRRPLRRGKVLGGEICQEYRARACACRSSAPSPLSGRSGWASLRSSTTGPRTARTSRARRRQQPLPAADVEDLCDAIYLCRHLPAREGRTTSSTSAPRSSRPSKKTTRLCSTRRASARRSLDPGRAGHLDAAAAGEGESFPALQVGLRDSDRGFVCLDREGGAGAGLSTPSIPTSRR
jgi:hypothetical protein